MPHIHYDTAPASIGEGRSARNISYQGAGNNWVAEVDTVSNGETEITPEEYAAAVAANAAWDAQNPAPAAPASPDPNGFLETALGTLGLIAGNALLAKWPTFTVALNARNWVVTRQVLDAALSTGDLTQAQHEGLSVLLAKHNIP